jgi:hypothetical protein
MKYFEQTSETLATCATLSIYFCNIHMKQLQHISETSKTLNIHLQHALSSQHLLTEVACRGVHSVDSAHNLLVGNDGASRTSTLGARGGRGMARSSEGMASNELERARREMERGAASEGA